MYTITLSNEQGGRLAASFTTEIWDLLTPDRLMQIVEMMQKEIEDPGPHGWSEVRIPQPEPTNA